MVYSSLENITHSWSNPQNQKLKINNIEKKLNEFDIDILSTKLKKIIGCT